MFKRAKKEWDGKYGWALKLSGAILIVGLCSCGLFNDGVQDGLDNEPKVEEVDEIIVGDKTFTEENLIRYVENLEKQVDQLLKGNRIEWVELNVDGETKTYDEQELAEFISEIMNEKVVLQDELDNTKTELENTKIELESVKTELEEQETSEKEIVEEEIVKNETISLTYEDLARNPEENKGKPVEFYGEVIQVVEGLFTNKYRFVIDGDYDQVILLEIPSSVLEERILEGDLLTIKGVSQGNTTYTTVLGASMTIPNVLITDFTLEN